MEATLEKGAHNVLSGEQRIKLYEWLKASWEPDALVKKTDSAIADMASSNLPFVVSVGNVTGMRRDMGYKRRGGGGSRCGMIHPDVAKTLSVLCRLAGAPLPMSVCEAAKAAS